MPGLRLGKEAQAKVKFTFSLFSDFFFLINFFFQKFDEAKANPDHKGFLEKRGKSIHFHQTFPFFKSY